MKIYIYEKDLQFVNVATTIIHFRIKLHQGIEQIES